MAKRTTASNGTRTSARNRTGSGSAAAGRREPAATAPRQQQDRQREAESCVISTQSRTGRAVGGLKRAGSAVGDTLAAHPVPAFLIGAGLAWLLAENRLGGRGTDGSAGLQSTADDNEEATVLGRARKTYREVSQRYANGLAKDKLAAGVGRVGEKLSDAAQSVRGGASRVGEYTQQGARAVGSKLRGGAAVVGQGARKGFQYTRQGASSAWHQHPLTTGLAALATGMAVGMVLPGTWAENDIMGRRSDALSQRIRSAAGTYFERGRQAASTTVGSLAREVEDEGLAPGQVARKVRRIAGHVQQAAATAVRADAPVASASSGRRNSTQARSRKK